MDTAFSDVHRTHMPKKPQPGWSPTFLRAWREFRKKTLEEVAPKMGLTHGQLSKIERGRHPYNQHVLEVAAKEYKCSVQDLLTRAPDDQEGIWSVWESAGPAQRRQILEVAKTLIKTSQ